MQNPWEIFVWPILAGMVAVMLSILLYFGPEISLNEIIALIRIRITGSGTAVEREIRIREETLRSVSLELHDRVGHILTIALLHLERNQSSSPHAPPQQVIRSLVTDALEAIRHISSSYNAEQIPLLGLSAAIKNELDFLDSSTDFTTHSELKGEPVFLDDRVETAVFRIFQEAITNIIRHARATRVEVIIKYSQSCLILSIQDNGKGFDVGRQLNRNYSRGNGLSNIIRRTRSIGGVPEIASGQNIGTIIRIKIPTRK